MVTFRLTPPREWQRGLPTDQAEDRFLIVGTHLIIPIRSTTSISSMWMGPHQVHHQSHLLTPTLTLTNHNPLILHTRIIPFTRLIPTIPPGPLNYFPHCQNNFPG